MTESNVKFRDAISDVLLPNGQVWDGTGNGDPMPKTWTSPALLPIRAPIDVSWYEEQRIRIRAVEEQAGRVNETLGKHWYKIIRQSLADLPIQVGGRSLQNPEYGMNIRNIAAALAISPRTLSGYRTAVSRIGGEDHFNELIKTSTWSQIVFSFTAGPMRRLMEAGSPDSPAPSGMPPVKRRFVVQVPTQLADFLMENGLTAPDVTAVVVAHLRQPKIHRELLKLFKSAAASPTAPDGTP